MISGLGSIDPTSVYNGSYNVAAMAFPTGLLNWSDMGSVVVWFVLIAFVGSMLGILRERTSGRRASEGSRAPLSDARLRHAS
jgi:hypothetical protein